MSGKDIVDFKISGKVGVAVIATLVSSILSIGGLVVSVNAQKEALHFQSLRIEALEKNCGLISVSIGRIEENTGFLKERITDLKHSLEATK